MKAEKMIVEVERTRNEKQVSRLSTYRDKLKDVCTASEEGKKETQMHKGENKEYSDQVIKEILEKWDRDVCKTTNQEGDREHEAD